MKKTKPRTTREKLTSVAPNLYRHENGTYYGAKKINGRPKLLALGTADRKTADGKLRAWLAELAETSRSGNPDMTLGMLAEKFQAARAGNSEETRKVDAWFLNKLRATFPRPMDTPLVRVLPSDVAGWLAKIKTGLRAWSFHSLRSSTRKFFRLAVLDGVMARSLFVEELAPTMKPEEVARPIPTEEEFLRIVAEIRAPGGKVNAGKTRTRGYARNPEAADFVEFLGRAGVGQAEAAALMWADVGESRLTFIRKKTRRKFFVLITAKLRPLLARRRAAAGGEAACGRVFKIKSAEEALGGACLRLGGRHYSQRNLRSFKIVQMLDAGVDVKFAAEAQGHSDGGKLIATTYANVLRANVSAYEAEQLARMEAGPRKAADVVPFRAVA